MKIYLIWLIGVILWNFGYPTATPIEDVLAERLVETGNTLAVYEDTTQGMLSERILKSSGANFLQGIIGNGNSTLKSLLSEVLGSDELGAINAQCSYSSWVSRVSM